MHRQIQFSANWTGSILLPNHTNPLELTLTGVTSYLTKSYLPRKLKENDWLD